MTGLFDIPWLLGMPPAYLSWPVPKDTRVTVLVPARNEQAHLRAAVTSLLAQTFRLFSIVIIDDGSTDETGRIAEELAAENPGRVFVVHTMGTGSKAGGLNEALADKEWLGDYITVMDGDTEYAPDAMEKAMPHFYDPSVAVVCGYVLPKAPLSGKASIWLRSKFVEYLLGQDLTKAAQYMFGALIVSSGCFSIYATSLIGQFSNETMAEDMHKTWDLQIEGWKAAYAENSVCYAAEPETFRIFFRQRWRWQCGFLQCYKLRIREVIRKNMRLAIVVHYMFAIALTDIVFVPLGAYLLWKHPELSVILPSVVDIGVMVVVLGCYAFMRGGTRLLWESLCSVPAALVGILVVRYIFLYAIVSEWFLKKRLTKWAAGH